MLRRSGRSFRSTWPPAPERRTRNALCQQPALDFRPGSHGVGTNRAGAMFDVIGTGSWLVHLAREVELPVSRELSAVCCAEEVRGAACLGWVGFVEAEWEHCFSGPWLRGLRKPRWVSWGEARESPLSCGKVRAPRHRWGSSAPRSFIHQCRRHCSCPRTSGFAEPLSRELDEIRSSRHVTP